MVTLGEWLTGRLHCTTGLINLEAIQKNEDGERAKYLFHEKFSSKDDNEKWDFRKVDRDRLVQWNFALRPHPVVALTWFHCIVQFDINTVDPR